ncbi:MAG: hypothetical protein FJ221_01560 [Lentisphaerae bacterium]|nr:hypothetical protein [Lentisphaerota bacterium]
MKIRTVLSVATLVALAFVPAVRAAEAKPAASPTPAPAAAPAAPAPAAGAALAAPGGWSFDAGGDLRLRQETFLIPINRDPPGYTRGGENNYFRIRPRVWGQIAAPEILTLRTRLTQEFRHYEQPRNDGQDYPDEWVVDNLYLDASGLLDGAVDVRIGRQDLMYGNGRVILEGTPKDGSRTIYIDAAKVTLKTLVPETTIDLLGIYTEPENELAINRVNRDLTGQTSAYDDITESGGGVYLKNKSLAKMPFEAYYLYKQESDWDSGPATNRVHHDTLNLHTAGFRLMPKFSDAVDGNLEAAYQVGEQGDADVTGAMVDAFVQARLSPVWEPRAKVGWYYISGDDPGTSDIEGWNPLWARWPQYSELYIYAWDADGAARWSNVSMPYAEVSFTPCRWFKGTAMAGYMMAPENDGPGPGNDRGWLYVAKGEFTLFKGLLCKRDKLSGHLWLEILDPEDYYRVSNMSYFARWQLMYEF